MSELTGNWEEVEKRLKALGPKVQESIKLSTRQNALMLEATLVEHIQNQDLRWKKLSPAYKKYKIKKGLSSNILIATSQYMQSITTSMIDGGLSAFVGVLRRARRKDGSLGFDIALTHEYGSKARGIDARPLFTPTFEEKRVDIYNNYKKNLGKVLEQVANV